MHSHTLKHEPVRSATRRQPGHYLLRLGWPHFWLLISILGGMLALVALVISAYRWAE
jgi:hypothetical protein